MPVTLEITLDDDEAQAFAALFCEMDRCDPSTRWSPSMLAKSLLLGVVFDDLEAHQRGATVN